jgi:hypothetical protein
MCIVIPAPLASEARERDQAGTQDAGPRTQDPGHIKAPAHPQQRRRYSPGLGSGRGPGTTCRVLAAPG